MVTRVPIYLGGTGESTQASAQAALGLHTSNSVAFTTVTIGAVNVLANDGATLLSAYSNDVTTLATARGNDHATLLSAYSNDVTTLATARGNDHATLISATTNPIITGNVLINSNSANDALRINQIGSGNAFVVEDSANPDATPFVITGAGNMGLGIANPPSKLSVYAASTVEIRANSGTTDFRATAFATGSVSSGAYSNHPYQLVTNNSVRIHIAETGLVGIGTANPSTNLETIGTGRFTGQLTLSNHISFSNTLGSILSYTNNFSMSRSGGSESFRVDTSGNVGIGTSSPTATLDVVGTFSDAKANTVQQTLTDAATIAWDTSLGRIATVTLGASRTFGAPTNIKVGTYILHVIQGGTGSYTITWNGVFKWTAATAPTLSTDVGRRDVFSFISDGTNLYGAMIPDVR